MFTRSQDATNYATNRDRKHKCWEKDVETQGKKFSAEVPLEKCRPPSPRVTRLNYLGQFEGCYEVDSVLGMDVWIRALPEKDCTARAAIDTSFRQVIDKAVPDKKQMKGASGARPE